MVVFLVKQLHVLPSFPVPKQRSSISNSKHPIATFDVIISWIIAQRSDTQSANAYSLRHCMFSCDRWLLTSWLSSLFIECHRINGSPPVLEWSFFANRYHDSCRRSQDFPPETRRACLCDDEERHQRQELRHRQQLMLSAEKMKDSCPRPFCPCWL